MALGEASKLATTSKSATQVLVNNKVYQRVWDFQSKKLRQSSLHETESDQVRSLIKKKLKNSQFLILFR